MTSRLRSFKVDNPKIKSITGTVCSYLGVADYDLAVAFVAPPKMRSLNKTFRHRDRSTDVLSFPQQEWRTPRKVVGRPTKISSTKNGPPSCLGDLVISLVDAERNAREIGQSLDREVSFLLVHGLLHLVGHDHETRPEERRMLSAQRQLMKVLERPQPPLWKNCVRRTNHV